MCGSYFLISSATLSLLIRALNPFKFKVIIDRYLFSFHLCNCVPLSLTLFLHLLKALPLAYVVEVYSFSPLLSGKLLISPSILIESLAGLNSLGYRLLLFSTWNISCHSLLAFSVFVEKSSDSLIGAPLHVTSCFSLAAFKILSLSINFCLFTYDVS